MFRQLVRSQLISTGRFLADMPVGRGAPTVPIPSGRGEPKTPGAAIDLFLSANLGRGSTKPHPNSRPQRQPSPQRDMPVGRSGQAGAPRRDQRSLSPQSPSASTAFVSSPRATGGSGRGKPVADVTQKFSLGASQRGASHEQTVPAPQQTFNTGARLNIFSKPPAKSEAHSDLSDVLPPPPQPKSRRNKVAFDESSDFVSANTGDMLHIEPTAAPMPSLQVMSEMRSYAMDASRSRVELINDVSEIDGAATFMDMAFSSLLSNPSFSSSNAHNMLQYTRSFMVRATTAKSAGKEASAK